MGYKVSSYGIPGSVFSILQWGRVTIYVCISIRHLAAVIFHGELSVQFCPSSTFHRQCITFENMYRYCVPMLCCLLCTTVCSVFSQIGF